jgi:hypothetical protein
MSIEGAEEVTLFDLPPTPPRTLYRATDPDTSRAAAESIEVTGLEQMVYEAICRVGREGRTQDELLILFHTYSYSSITARPAALKRKGLIGYSGEKRAGMSGRAQNVLVAAKYLPSEPHA